MPLSRESSARSYAPRLPIVPVRAAGTTVTDESGRPFLDCLSGAGALALGHNHPVVVEAIRRTLDSGAPMTTLDLTTPVKDAFVDGLFSILPPSLAARGRVHFCGPTGADAVEAAVKLCLRATGRRGMLAFTGGYHGMTSGALALTGNVAARSGLASTPFEVTRLPFPYPYRCPFGVGGSATERLSSAYLARLLSDANGGLAPPAGLVVEPVQGEGGVVPAPDGWLRSVRTLTSRHDIPLIADEVQTGVGRTGAMWGVSHAGVEPDILVLSKAIGGGLPLAVIVYDEALDGWPAGFHTGTFRGNQLAMAAGEATLRFVAENDLSTRAHDLGVAMLGTLRDFARSEPTVGEVRGRGLMIGLEVVAPAGHESRDQVPDLSDLRDLPDLQGSADLPGDNAEISPPAWPELAARIQAECLARGLIVELGGRSDSVVRLLPPLTITDAEVSSVLARLTEAWSAAAAVIR